MVYIPLSMHIGKPAKAIVKAGDKVTIGQVIGEAGGFVSSAVHASVSGTVIGLQKRYMVYLIPLKMPLVWALVIPSL